MDAEPEKHWTVDLRGAALGRAPGLLTTPSEGAFARSEGSHCTAQMRLEGIPALRQPLRMRCFSCSASGAPLEPRRSWLAHNCRRYSLALANARHQGVAPCREKTRQSQPPIRGLRKSPALHNTGRAGTPDFCTAPSYRSMSGTRGFYASRALSPRALHSESKLQPGSNRSFLTGRSVEGPPGQTFHCRSHIARVAWPPLLKARSTAQISSQTPTIHWGSA